MQTAPRSGTTGFAATTHVRLGTNEAAATAARHFAINVARTADLTKKIGTGLRISSAGDDPAGLAISDVLQMQVRGIAQAIENTQDGISMIQTADGALALTSDVLQRMRDLLVMAANGSMSAQQRAAVSTELSSLQNAIDDIAQDTQFNQITLLNGNPPSLQLQIGPNSGDTMTVTLVDARAATIGVATISTAAATSGAATTGIATVDTALTTVSSDRASLGDQERALTTIAADLQVALQNQTAARSRVRDLDYSQALADLTQSQVRTFVSAVTLAQAARAQAPTLLTFSSRPA